MADDLAALERFLGPLVERLSPGARIRVARKIGEELRRANARRIAANVEPDGAAMEPRKRRKRLTDGKGRIRRTGKMFPKIRQARSLRITPSPDEVRVGFESPMIAHTARAHHEGLADYVGRTKDGKVIRTQYPRRRLLGISAADEAAIIDAAMEWLGR